MSNSQPGHKSITSTPARRSTSKAIISDDRVVSQSPKQESLKNDLAEEYVGATWEQKSDVVARTLSSKTRKAHLLPPSDHKIEKLIDYDIALDDWANEVLENAVRSFKGPTILPESSAEADHYEPVVKYLNACLAACKAAVPKPSSKAGRYYDKLNFIVWNKVLKDGVREAYPIKPDGAGAEGLMDGETQLWWRPKCGRRRLTMELPVEVKGDWWKLIKQAATYGRCLFEANPLRQFALVIAYQHNERAFRFFVFHSGGLTASPPLNPTNKANHCDILFLMLSLFTWESEGDAGLPEWRNSSEMFIQTNGKDEIGVKMDIGRIFYDRIGPRGRAGKVLKLVKQSSPTSPSGPASQPPDPSTIFQARKSPRLQARLEKNTSAHSNSKHREISNHVKSQTESRLTVLSPTSESHDLSSITENRSDRVAGRNVRFVRQVVLSYVETVRSVDLSNGIVLKFDWTVAKHASTERKMFEQCGLMFGVMKQFYSSIVHHKENLPVTNHLYYDGAKSWTVHTDSKSKFEPEYRALTLQVNEFAGEPLTSTPTPRQLIIAIVHAAIGYGNLIENGFHHRDISIGNILWSSTPMERDSVFNTIRPSNTLVTRSEVIDLLKQCQINTYCQGFVIDGNMAIQLDEYSFEDVKHTRSGTVEFMSEPLLNAAYDKRPYVQSPLDDLESLYYVGQWAAVNNNSYFDDINSVPGVLRTLRDKLAGPMGDRSTGTNEIIQTPLEVDLYGSFLVECRAFLKDWKAKLVELREFWQLKLKDIEADEGKCLDLFRSIIDKGLLDILGLLMKHFPEKS